MHVKVFFRINIFDAAVIKYAPLSLIIRQISKTFVSRIKKIAKNVICHSDINLTFLCLNKNDTRLQNKIAIKSDLLFLLLYF